MSLKFELHLTVLWSDDLLDNATNASQDAIELYHTMGFGGATISYFGL
jgi:hypothetical protein